MGDPAVQSHSTAGRCAAQLDLREDFTTALVHRAAILLSEDRPAFFGVPRTSICLDVPDNTGITVMHATWSIVGRGAWFGYPSKNEPQLKPDNPYLERMKRVVRHGEQHQKTPEPPRNITIRQDETPDAHAGGVDGPPEQPRLTNVTKFMQKYVDDHIRESIRTRYSPVSVDLRLHVLWARCPYSLPSTRSATR